MHKNTQLPEVTFSTFILSLASSTLMHLGEVPNPDTGKTEKNILLAKHSVDLLNMLEDKFTNGLNSDEQKLLQDILYEVKIKYIQQA